MSGLSGLGQSQPYGSHQITRAVDKLVSHKDADGNGTLSAEELGGPEGSFEKVDTNSDGQVDKTELAANKPRPLFNHIAAQITRKMDTDGNGTLSAEELDVSAEQFDEYDKNQDGQIDKRELGGFLKQLDGTPGQSQPVDSTQSTTGPIQVTPSQTQINIYNETNVFLKTSDLEGEPGIESQQV